MGTRQLPRSALSCAVLALFCALALTSAYAQGVPSGWECAEDQYNDGFFCDCECGVYDPDCAVADNSFCLALETCQNVNGLGSCVPIGEGGSPGGPTIDEEGEGCLVEGSNNFDENAEVPCDDCCVACLEPEAANFVEGAHIPCNDCCNLQAECDDPEAANYEPLSVLDPCPNRECCVYEGCTDPLADEGSYDPRNTIPCQDSCCLYTGCTDPTADVGYDPKHNVACDECCGYEGCTLVGRVNTDPRANLPCNGDNSCCGDALGLEPSTDLFDLIDVVMGPVGIARRAAGRTAGEIFQMVLENQAEGLAKEAIGGLIDETASGRLERRIDSVNDRVIEGLAPYYEAIEDQIMNGFRG